MAFTYFFRDLQTLTTICEQSLPELKTRQYINIWDAGCAMGPEPYTLAILLRERMSHMYFRNVRIKATDIDGSNLFEEIIERGIYPRKQVERIPRDVFMKYFAETENGDFQISEELRRAVSFQKHDLLTLKSIGRDFGLILCKNVLLHFSEPKRIEVVKMFHSSLSPGGFLATEQTQKLPAECSELFEQVVSNAQLFRKRT